MLDADLKVQLKNYLSNLKTPIELCLSLGEDASSSELNQLANEIAELSELVSVNLNGTAKRQPTMEVRSSAGDKVMAFAGIPMGHEFTSLVLALLHCGGHPLKLEADVIEQVANLEGEFTFETYVSLSCQNCPDVVQAINMMAAINPKIRHTMIDGALFESEVLALNIKAVPAVYLNGQPLLSGRITIKDLLHKLDSKAASREAAQLSEKESFDMLILGGGPAGASAAIYAARKGLRTGIVADRFGGQVADTVGIENFISVPYTEGPKLVNQLEQHVTEYAVDVMSGQKVKQVKAGDGFTITTESGATLKATSVVVATGASWRKMNVPGEAEYSGKGVAYCPHCDGPLFKGKRVAVIGGGNSGIEAAIDLSNIVEHVTVLEFSDQLKADEVLVRKARHTANIDIILSAQTQEVLGDGQQVTGLKYLDRRDQQQHEITLAGVFVQIGLVPNSGFLQDTVELSKYGEVVVDEKGRTSLPGLFACGDVTTVPYKQIVIAMGEGAKASLSAFDYLMRLQPKNDALESKSEKAA